MISLTRRPTGPSIALLGSLPRLFEVPISIVSIVDADRIWFKSHYGLDVEAIARGPETPGTPRRAAGAYCGHLDAA